MVYNISTDLWYQYFMRNDGPQAWILFGFYGYRLFFASFGILLNLSLVYLTAKCVNLHSICNILLAAESFFSLINHIGYLPSFFVVASGVRFLRYRLCAWLVWPTVVAGNVAQLLMVIISVERLAAVLFPIWYKSQAKFKIYLMIVFMLIAYAVFECVLFYLDYIESDDVMLTCENDEMGQSVTIGAIRAVKSMVLSGCLLSFYTIMWLVVYAINRFKYNLSENKRRITKCLLVIAGLNLCGIFIRQMMKYYFNAYPPNPFVKRGLKIFTTLMTIIVYSANAPVLYIFSSSYRTEFNKQFKWLPKCFGSDHQLPPSNSTRIMANLHA